MSADAFGLSPVFVCDKCGQGFLTAQPFDLHQYPVWKWLAAEREGEVCGGHISLKPRIGTGKLSQRSTL